MTLFIRSSATLVVQYSNIIITDRSIIPKSFVFVISLSWIRQTLMCCLHENANGCIRYFSLSYSPFVHTRP